MLTKDKSVIYNYRIQFDEEGNFIDIFPEDPSALSYTKLDNIEEIALLIKIHKFFAKHVKNVHTAYMKFNQLLKTNVYDFK